MATPVVISNKHYKKYKHVEVHLDGYPLRLAWMDMSIPSSKDETLATYPNHVLVQKIAFSCNYRDRGIMIRMSNSDKKSLFPFGSDFVARVIAVGKNVRTVKIGDKVIPNGNFPETVGSSRRGLPTNHASLEYDFFDEHKLLTIDESIADTTAAAFTVGGQTSYGILDKLGINENTQGNMLIWSVGSNTSLFVIEALRKYPKINVYGVSTKTTYNERLQQKGVKEIFAYDGDSAKFKQNMRDKIDFFDYIFDPFSDIHFMESPWYLKMGGKYITCGGENQYPGSGSQYDAIPHIVTQLHLTPIFHQIIIKNLQILGNCLGSTQNLLSAVDDCKNNRFSIEIDSVFNYKEVPDFISRTFLDKSRFGKVICNL